MRFIFKSSSSTALKNTDIYKETDNDANNENIEIHIFLSYKGTGTNNI